MALQYALLLTSIVIYQRVMSSTDFVKFTSNVCIIHEEDLIWVNTSLQVCFKHCKLRTGCVAFNYMQKMSLCRLNFGENIAEQCNGYIHSKKTDWDQNGFEKCSCASEQICSDNDNCATSECDRLHPPEKGKVFGTRVGIGDKVAFTCEPGYIYNGTTKRVCTVGGTWSGHDGTCIEDPNCKNYLVGGPDGVKDSQLTQSDYWCNRRDCLIYYPEPPDGSTAKYAKLNMTGVVTGGWISPSIPNPEYVQVDFQFVRPISAIVLQSRHYTVFGTITIIQYVTSFNVLTSMDCAIFTTITDEVGNDKLFDGNNAVEEIVIRGLPEIVRTRCVRIVPVTWHGWNSLRFDVLGC